MGAIRRWMILFCTTVVLAAAILPQRSLAAESRTLYLQTDISEPGRKRDSFAVGQLHSWMLRGELPEEIGEAGKYVINQTLPSSLTFEEGSLGVALSYPNGKQVPLEMGVHYTLTAGTVMAESKPADRISISLTVEGMTFAGAHNGAELLVTYDARINETASMGAQIVASAQLNYTDPENERHVILSDKASVYTGGFRILVSDASGSGVAGACFMLAHRASESEIGDPKILTELLDTGEETIAVVYEPFFSTEDLSEKTDIAVTGKDGTAMLFGIAFGTYYLVQIEVPEGKQPMVYPLQVEVDEASHLTAGDGWKNSAGQAVDNRIRITNPGILMPQTGGPGTAGYTVSGVVVILSACVLLWSNRKRKVKI